MLRTHFHLSSVALFVALSASIAAAEESVLVLNDGGVLRGTITREGDRYIVVGAKSRLEVATSNAAVASGSLAEAYDEQRRQLPHDTSEAHLGLADWCLRYNLLPQAVSELTDVRRLDPHSSKLDLLQRRLDLATQTANPRKAGDGEAEEATQQSTAESARLDAIAAELPAGAVERFTRKVQPLLVNSCTTSGCHQEAGRQVFQLDRAVLHGLSNHRTTLNNLAATLALVNRDAPQMSLLLTIPRTEHAGMKQPLMGSRQDQQFRQLEEWVAIVTATPMPDEEPKDLVKAGSDAGSKRTTAAQRRSKLSAIKAAKGEPKPFHLDDTQAAKPIAAASDDVADAPQPAANSSSTVIQASDEEPLPFAQLRQRKRPAATTVKSWEPKDAFDPDIFNRQNATAGSAETNSGSSAAPAPNH